MQSSRYAAFLGAPTAAWGALLYALVVGLALGGFTVRRWLAVFAMVAAAVAFSLTSPT